MVLSFLLFQEKVFPSTENYSHSDSLLAWLKKLNDFKTSGLRVSKLSYAELSRVLVFPVCINLKFENCESMGSEGELSRNLFWYVFHSSLLSFFSLHYNSRLFSSFLPLPLLLNMSLLHLLSSPHFPWFDLFNQGNEKSEREQGTFHADPNHRLLLPHELSCETFHSWTLMSNVTWIERMLEVSDEKVKRWKK